MTYPDRFARRRRYHPARRFLWIGCGWLALLSMCMMAAGLAAADERDPGQAPGTANAAPLPSVAQIIAANTLARGSAEAWRAVHALSEVGHVQAGTVASLAGKHPPAMQNPQKPQRVSTEAHRAAVPFTMNMQRPHQWYLQVRYNGAAGIQVFDGKEGWTVMPSSQGAVVKKYPPEAARAAALQLDLDGPLLDSAAKGTEVVLEGSELIDGRPTYRLKLTLRDKQVRHLWIDAETFLDRKIDGTRVVGTTAWPMETYFSAYKSVNGLQIAHVLDTAIGGARTTERITIDHVTVNPRLDQAMFSWQAYAPDH